MKRFHLDPRSVKKYWLRASRCAALSSWIFLACSGSRAINPADGSAGDSPTHSDSAGTADIAASTDAPTRDVQLFPDTIRSIGTCADLPAPGVWEDIAPFRGTVGDGMFINFSEAIAIDPYDPAVVWLGSGRRGLWKSTDCGASWNVVSTGRNSDSIEHGNLTSLVIDPVQRGVMYTAPIYGPGGFWKSTNAGVDWDQMFPSDVLATVNTSDSVSMDPTNHSHLLVGMHANCTAPWGPTCETETTDGGATWRLLRSPPGLEDARANWEEGAAAWIVDSTTWLYGGLHLFLTTDSGASWQNLNPDPAQYFGMHDFFRGPDGTFYFSNSQGLVESHDQGRTFTVIPNSNGSTVGIAIGDGMMFTSDQWSTTYRSAHVSDLTQWQTIPPPAALLEGQGAAYLQYDGIHHILYSSNLAGGLWRIVMR